MIPVRLELTNFQSYDHAILDFNFDSALVVGERDGNADISNGSGKSVLFESIGWVLYGNSRQKNADGVVKRNCDFCEVDFIFTHDSKKFRINRKRNSRFSKVDLSLYELAEDGTEMAIQGDTNKEVDAKIRAILKSNYEVFLNSCYFRQNTISDFMNGTPAAKQKIISSILNLDRWNKYMEAAKGKLIGHNKVADNIMFKLKGTESIGARLIEARVQLEANKKIAKQLDSSEMLLGEEINKLETRVNNLKLKETSLNDYHDNVSKLDNVSDRLVELKNSIKEKQLEIERLTENISSNDRTANELKEKIEEISGHLELKGKFDLHSLEENFVKGKTKFSVVQDDLDRWDGEAVCQCCSRPWKEHEDKIKENNDKRKQLQDIGKKLAKLSQKISAVKSTEEKIRNAEIEIEKYTGRLKGLANSVEIYQLKLEVLWKLQVISQME